MPVDFRTCSFCTTGAKCSSSASANQAGPRHIFVDKTPDTVYQPTEAPEG